MNLDIFLPARVTQPELPNLLRVLGRGDASEVTQVTLDFSRVSFYKPASLVALLAKARRWSEAGKLVVVRGHETCGAAGYLSRIGILKELDAPIVDGRTYRESAGRFVPVQVIETTTDCDEIARSVSICAIPESDSDSEELRKILFYAMGELIKNCQQHSRSGRGYLLAQFFPQEGMVHVAIADAGRGIVASYRENQSPRFREDMSDGDGLLEALTLESSSTTHRRTAMGELSPNRGIGLTMSRQLTMEAYGDFLLCSGTAIISHDTVSFSTAAPMLVSCFQGVLCSLTFSRSALRNMSYLDVLTDVKVKLGLMPNPGQLTPENLFQT